jgi:hypothetical protein
MRVELRMDDEVFVGRWGLVRHCGTTRVIMTLEPLRQCTCCGNKAAKYVVLANVQIHY